MSYPISSAEWDTQLPVILEKMLYSIDSHDSIRNKNKIDYYFDRFYLQSQSSILKKKDPYVYNIIENNICHAQFLLKNLIYVYVNTNTLLNSSIAHSKKIDTLELFSRVLNSTHNKLKTFFSDYIINTKYTFLVSYPRQYLDITVPDPFGSTIPSSGILWKTLFSPNVKHPQEIDVHWKRNDDEFFIKMLHPVVSKPILTYVLSSTTTILLPVHIIKFKKNVTYIYKIPPNEKSTLHPNNSFLDIKISFEILDSPDLPDDDSVVESSKNFNTDGSKIISSNLQKSHLFSDLQTFSISIQRFEHGLEFQLHPTYVQSVHKFLPLVSYYLDDTESVDLYNFPIYSTDSSGFFLIHNVIFNEQMLPTLTSYICTIVYNRITNFKEKIASLCVLPKIFNIIEQDNNQIKLTYSGVSGYSSESLADSSPDSSYLNEIFYEAINFNDSEESSFQSNDKDVFLIYKSRIFKPVERNLLRYISSGFIPSDFLNLRITLIGYTTSSLHFETFSTPNTRNFWDPALKWGGLKIAFSQIVSSPLDKDYILNTILENKKQIMLLENLDESLEQNKLENYTNISDQKDVFYNFIHT
jgi:hypothetical protein